LFFLDSDENYITDFNITTWNYNLIYNWISDLLPNEPPVAINAEYTLDEDTQINIYLSATDSDGDALTFNIIDQPSNGMLVLDGVSTTYMPNANFNGTDNFTFIANDGQFNSNVATITLTVNPVNDAPYLLDIPDAQVESSSIFTTQLQAVDVDGDELTYTASVTGNATATVSGNMLTIIPEPWINGIVFVAVTVSDGVMTDSTDFTLTVFTYGCTDIEACNYNPDATVDDGSCEYFNPEILCDCEGTLLDINGNCCSSLFLDDCGVCYGDNECACDDPFINIDGQCLHSDDIAVLQAFIDNSYASGIDLGCEDSSIYCGSPNPQMDSPTDSWFWNIIDGESYYFADGDGFVEPLELGLQEWNDGRLTSLMCGAYIYCQLSGPIPQEINLLTEIEQLRLEYNHLSGFIPGSICELDVDHFDYLAFDVDGNSLCPPYPECIDISDFWYQNTDSCYEIGDLNEDGMINVVDVILLVNIVLNDENYFPEGDINQDGLNNVVDIVSLVNIILN